MGREGGSLASPVGGKETILVAEDDAEVRRLTKNVLQDSVTQWWKQSMERMRFQSF